MHTKDVHGKPWVACEACPHPTPGSCPSRGHRRWCGLARQARATLAQIAALPPDDRPARDVRPRPPAVSPDPGRVAAIASQRLLVLGCDYRGSHEIHLGCGRYRQCHMGRGRPLSCSPYPSWVGHGDCLRCVTGRELGG
jgi:hypothetical protein